jgi:hypothetical protein
MKTRMRFQRFNRHVTFRSFSFFTEKLFVALKREGKYFYPAVLPDVSAVK